jgi:uncharacterized protein YjiS (DUF1127 family)
MQFSIMSGVSRPFFEAFLYRNRRKAYERAASVALRTVITRRSLAELDDRALDDVGLTRADALAEASRMPWDIEHARYPKRGLHKPPLRARLRGWLQEAMRRYHSRKLITGLNDWTLKDIGVSASEAEHEANKPFWRE